LTVNLLPRPRKKEAKRDQKLGFFDFGGIVEGLE
jgi:hypothetical protein